jgi:phosphoglycerol transferase
VFMGGASTAFAGKGKFLRSHQYHEVLGKEDWEREAMPDNAMNGWGLFDEDLLMRARTRLSELHASGQPFNLTVLTVDSHEPAGHLSKSCMRRGFVGFDGVIRCTASHVAAFVHFVRERGYLENTNIVILGDHLARRNPLSESLEKLPERLLFNAFIGNDTPARAREQLVHFDLLPTILEFTGFSVAEGRLGLGYSAFNHHGSQPDPQRLIDMRSSLLNRSETYSALWSAARR